MVAVLHNVDTGVSIDIRVFKRHVRRHNTTMADTNLETLLLLRIRQWYMGNTLRMFEISISNFNPPITKVDCQWCTYILQGVEMYYRHRQKWTTVSFELTQWRQKVLHKTGGAKVLDVLIHLSGVMHTSHHISSPPYMAASWTRTESTQSCLRVANQRHQSIMHQQGAMHACINLKDKPSGYSETDWESTDGYNATQHYHTLL